MGDSIRLNCPICATALLLKKTSGSEKTRCPKCKAPFVVPDGKIRYICTKCTKACVIDARSAGRPCTCPTCQTKFIVPATSAARSRVQVNCDTCNRPLSVKSNLVNLIGKTVECVSCFSTFTIDRKSARRMAPCIYCQIDIAVGACETVTCRCCQGTFDSAVLDRLWSPEAHAAATRKSRSQVVTMLTAARRRGCLLSRIPLELLFVTFELIAEVAVFQPKAVARLVVPSHCRRSLHSSVASTNKYLVLACRSKSAAVLTHAGYAVTNISPPEGWRVNAVCAAGDSIAFFAIEGPNAEARLLVYNLEHVIGGGPIRECSLALVLHRLVAARGLLFGCSDTLPGVAVLREDGTLVRVIADSEPEHQFIPTAVAVSGGKVYATRRAGRRPAVVVVYQVDTGEHIMSFGEGSAVTPWSICVRGGLVFVAGDRRVVVFSLAGIPVGLFDGSAMLCSEGMCFSDAPGYDGTMFVFGARGLASVRVFSGDSDEDDNQTTMHGAYKGVLRLEPYSLPQLGPVVRGNSLSPPPDDERNTTSTESGLAALTEDGFRFGGFGVSSGFGPATGAVAGAKAASPLAVPRAAASPALQQPLLLKDWPVTLSRNGGTPQLLPPAYTRVVGPYQLVLEGIRFDEGGFGVGVDSVTIALGREMGGSVAVSVVEGSEMDVLWTPEKAQSFLSRPAGNLSAAKPSVDVSVLRRNDRFASFVLEFKP